MTAAEEATAVSPTGTGTGIDVAGLTKEGVLVVTGADYPTTFSHEIAGTVEKVVAEVSRVSPGQRVAVNPSRPCDQCRYCRAGQHNQCLDMRFIGSAMRFPHVQGGFRQNLTVDEKQAISHRGRAAALLRERLDT